MQKQVNGQNHGQDRGEKHGQNRGELKRIVSLPLLTLYGLGMMIGAGIYVLIGATAADAGLYAPLSFIFAGAIAALTAASYAELSSRYPVSAGEAAYMDAAFGLPNLALLTGLAIAIGAAIASALLIKGGAGYLAHLLPFSRDNMAPFITLLIGVIAMWGIKESISIAAMLTVLEISGLLMIIFAGFFWPHSPAKLATQPYPPFDMDAITGILSASLLAFFAFTGFQDIVNIAEEVKDPKRNIPLALAISLVVTIILYVLVAHVAIQTVPIAELKDTNAPLTLVFERATGLGGNLVSAIAVAAVLNGALIHFVMASRVLYGLSRMGALPKLVGNVYKPTGTPLMATCLITGLTFISVLVLPFRELAIGTSSMALLGFALVNAALIRIKLQKPEVSDAFLVPISVPILGLASTLGLFLYVVAVKFI